jgi:tetratricopeptide (TPR) repeat protein
MEPGAVFKRSLPFLSVLALFYLLLTTVPASVYSGDDGETITASCTLGIQHPPGYPLYSLAGRLFTFIPAGDICFRLYMMSAALACVNFLLIYFFTLRLLPAIGINRHPAVLPYIPAFIFATGYTAWQQSIIAKGGIYIMNIMFVILISMSLFELLTSGKKEKWFYLSSFLYGVSLGNHLMLQIISLPAYCWLVYRSGILRSINFKTASTAAFLFLPGIAVYSFLPIRAGIAYLNWGDPSNLENFRTVITRWQYTGSEIARSFGSAWNQLATFFSSAAYESLGVGLALAAAGAYFIYKRSKDLFYYLLAIPALCMLATTFYLNLSKEHLYIMETYITPMYFPLAVLAAAGIFFIAGKAAGLTGIRALTVETVIFLAVFAAQTVYFYPRLDKSRYFFVYDYVKNMLDSLEENSMIFITGDGVVFPCWYFKYIKKYRPDVAVIGSAVLPMQWVRDGIKRQNPWIRVPGVKTKNIGTESIGYLINALIKMNFNSFNIYFSYNTPEVNSLDADMKLMPKGMVYKIAPAGQAYVSDKFIVSNENLWKYYNMRGIYGGYREFIGDKTVNLYVQDYSVSKNHTGTFFEDSLFYGKSLEYFTLAHDIEPQDNEYIYNMGNAEFNLKHYDAAIINYKKSIALKPDYENGWYNLGVAYYTIRNFPESLAAFEQVIKINPARKDVLSNIALIKGLVGH